MVKTEFKNGVLTAYLGGEIDHHTAILMRETIDGDAELYKPSMLILDFAKVRFMDSSGIGLIMGRCRMMSLLGGKVRLDNIPPGIKKIIDLSGVKSITC
ncbi:MAG: anti-sigma factor antagonist [Clostridia bacterium]|nr:anti-sigma factor antagonist [Clostridia bacterium]